MGQKSYESEINKKFKNNEKNDLPKRLNYSVLKYFWESSPLSRRRKEAIPYFLRNVNPLQNFTDNELRILSKYLHMRSFSEDEIIFEQGARGVGFYFIFSGEVILQFSEKEFHNISEEDKDKLSADYGQLASLSRYDYFGELALIEEHSFRTASACALSDCILLGLFRPDMEELIENDPLVGAKLIQSISIILAQRLANITNDMKIIHKKLMEFETHGNT